MSFVENLSYKYGEFKIQFSRWEILDEGVTVLWGPSGSGKTTLLRILIGLEKATPGLKWVLKGQDLITLKVPERRLGVVFQTLELFPHMTARQNIEFAAKARKIPNDVYVAKLKKFADLLKMESFLDRSVQVLSGGEKQRVALVRALIGNPRLLLLDEPFSSLDESLREESRLLLKKVIQEEKIPVLMVTHDRQDVEKLADKVSKLENGTILDSVALS